MNGSFRNDICSMTRNSEFDLKGLTHLSTENYSKRDMKREICRYLNKVIKN